MAYKIEGTVSEDCKIYVINTSDDSMEQVKSVSAGAYIVDLLDEESIHVMAVSSGTSRALAYGDITANYVFNDYNSWFAIATGNDDGEAMYSLDGWYDEDGVDFAFGSSAHKICMRFTNVSIPKDAQIETAYIRLVISDNRTASDMTCNIRAIDEDNSPQRYDAAVPSDWGADDWDLLPRTTAVSADNLPSSPQTAGVVWTSVSIVDIIQEIVNRPGWSVNNALTLLMEDVQQVGNYVRFATYENTTYDEPRIYVEWRA